MIEGRTLWELVVNRAEATPDAVMLIDETGQETTFAEYRAQAERAAAGFQDFGISEGDVVSWQLPTWTETIVMVAALSRIGAIQNPMLPIYREREVGFVTRQADSKLLVVPGEWRGFDFASMAERIAADRDGLFVLVADPDLPSGDPATLPPPPATPDDPADLPVRWYYATSGTTSDPKVAQHTDMTINGAARGMSEALQIAEGDRVGCVFPFTHVAGVVYVISALRYGCTMIVVEAFDAQTTPPLLARHGVTLAGAGTPFHMAYLAYQRAHPDEAPLFPDCRALIGGGAPKPPQLHHDVKDEMGGVGIVSGYGMTEAPIMTMASIDDPDEELATTEGGPVHGVELRLVDRDGNEVARGQEGEISVKGPMVMRGYLDAELTAEAFDADGFLKTGDLGRLSDAGNIQITGRVKDIIIRNMENISAKEVEDLLFSHPKIADAAVVGLPDDRTGERVCAIVVPEDPSSPPTLEEILAHTVEQGLSKQKTPEQIEIVDSLPRNPTGKVLKFKLQEQFG